MERSQSAPAASFWSVSWRPGTPVWAQPLPSLVSGSGVSWGWVPDAGSHQLPSQGPGGMLFGCCQWAPKGDPSTTPPPLPSWSGLGPRLAQAVPAPPRLWAFDVGGGVSTVRNVRGGSGPGTEGVNGAGGCSPVAGGETGQTCVPGQSLAWGSGRGRGILAQHPERSRQASGALGSIPTRKVGNLPSGGQGGPRLGQGAGFGFSVSAVCGQAGLLFLL